MKLLLDTQILVWIVTGKTILSAEQMAVLGDLDNDLYFSVVSIWEIAIKQRLSRKNFTADATKTHLALLDLGAIELPLLSAHVLRTLELPLLHGDPFDRILLAQAIAEGLVLVTTDVKLAGYTGPILRW